MTLEYKLMTGRVQLKPSLTTGRHLENLFIASPEPKGQLTWNLVGSVGGTCISNISKIIPIRSPRWPPSWKSIFPFHSWTERPVDLKLGRKHWGDLLLFVGLWFILRCDLFYVLPCVILFLCFSVLLALRLPRLGKRELILVLFVRLFDLCLFGFVGFLFLLLSGNGCGLWLWHSLDFSLTFFL